MGRELRRKEAKKNKNKITKIEKELDTSIHGRTVAKIVIFCVVLLLVLYYVIAVFITKETADFKKISWKNRRIGTNGRVSGKDSEKYGKNNCRQYMWFIRRIDQ